MCLAVPMTIECIDGTMARCTAQGVARQVNLFLLTGEPLDVGDCVLVHVGYAIQKITPEDAQLIWESVT